MVKPNLKVNIGGLDLRNPVIVASGTFGSGEEYKDLLDLDKIGAIITKSITLRPREGNPPPRVIETPSGMLNSIGLQNYGLDAFIKDKIPFLNKIKAAVIVSIAAHNIDDYAEIARKLDKIRRVDAIEINISCPNVKGGLEFAREPGSVAAVVAKVRAASEKPVL